jgi:hypothetical protein
MRGQLAIALSAAVMLAPSAPAGLLTEEPVQSEEYVPFVTDFPKPVAKPTPEPFVPFVTDFPKPAASPAANRSSSGIGRGDIGVAGGIAALLAALLAGSRMALTRRAKPARG